MSALARLLGPAVRHVRERPLLYLLLGAALASTGALVPFPGDRTPESPSEAPPPAPDSQHQERYRPIATGEASVYHPSLHGRPTASGETYDGEAMTAAHRTLPFGARVRVTHLRNGKTAIVRINDRGPFHSGRIIDLSPAAARRLGIPERGTAQVRLELLESSLNGE